VEWIELTPDEVAQCIIHVVMACVFIWIAFIGVALQL
jgi:hypothetical protein